MTSTIMTSQLFNTGKMAKLMLSALLSLCLFDTQTRVFVLSLEDPVLEDIGASYRRIAISEIQKEARSMERKPMERLTLSCKNSAYKKIIADFPFAEVRWKRNAENFVLEPSRMVTNLYSLTIQSLSPMDSGVYHCQLAIGENVHIIAAVFAVVVGNQTVRVSKGDSLTLQCHGDEIGKIFESATRVWIDPKSKEQFRKSAADTTPDVIVSADEKSAGMWTCKVEEKKLRFTWQTARINVTIDPAPSGLIQIINYTKQNKELTVGILFAGTFVLVLIVNGLTKLVEMRRKNIDKELEEIKKILGIENKLVGEDVQLLLDPVGEPSSGSSEFDEMDK